jgi:hypothetical protein
MNLEFYWVAVVATTILSAARLSRLAVIDKFPPVKAVREWYESRTDGSDWQWLTMCAFCMAPWVTLLVLGTGLLADVYGSGYDKPENPYAFLAWWLFNGWLAMSYLAATYVARDGAVGEDD